jgi:Ring finger domain
MSGIPGAHNQERARDLLIKEILRRRAEVDDLCPVKVRHRGDTYDSKCAVCLDMVECGDLQRTLRCGHAFHASCIDRWFMQMCDARYGGASPNCPVCKQNVSAKTIHAARPPLPPRSQVTTAGSVRAIGPIRIPRVEPGVAPSTTAV